MCPFLDLSQAYAMLLQDDNQINNSSGFNMFSHDSIAVITRFSSTKPKQLMTKKDDKKESYVVCDYCNMSRHSREKFFAFHGYLEWHRLFG